MKAILCSDNAYLIFWKHNYSISMELGWGRDEFELIRLYFKFKTWRGDVMFASAERTVEAANRVAVAMTLRVLLKSWILNKSRFQSSLAGQFVNRLRNPTQERAELMASTRPVSGKLCQHYNEVIKHNLIVPISMRTIFCAPTRCTGKAGGINHTSSRCIWKKFFNYESAFLHVKIPIIILHHASFRLNSGTEISRVNGMQHCAATMDSRG